MITSTHLVLERPHLFKYEGVQRIYRFGTSNMGLSVVNNPNLHQHPFAWEIAVIHFNSDNPLDFTLDYGTSLTGDVEIFSTDAEADDFIARAFLHFNELEKSKEPSSLPPDFMAQHGEEPHHD
ncbi:MAG: hypothetical protein ACREJW_00080 [Candidatus Methylomirabilales bacterium]